MPAASAEAIIALVPLVGRALATGGSRSLSFLPVTRNIVGDFAPCSPGTLYTDTFRLVDRPSRSRSGCMVKTRRVVGHAQSDSRAGHSHVGIRPETDETGQRYQ